jgi:hypothetical protein
MTSNAGRAGEYLLTTRGISREAGRELEIAWDRRMRNRVLGDLVARKDISGLDRSS